MYYSRDPCDPRKNEDGCGSGRQNKNGRGSKPQRAGTSGGCTNTNHSPGCPNYQYNYYCPPTDDGGEECSSDGVYWQACCACGGYHAQVKMTPRKEQCKKADPIPEQKKQGRRSDQTNGAEDVGADAEYRDTLQDPKWGVLNPVERSEFEELRERIRSADDTICILKDRCQTLTQKLCDAEDLNRCLQEDLNKFEGGKRPSGGGSAESSSSKKGSTGTTPMKGKKEPTGPSPAGSRKDPPSNPSKKNVPPKSSKKGQESDDESTGYTTDEETDDDTDTETVVEVKVRQSIIQAATDTEDDSVLKKGKKSK